MASSNYKDFAYSLIATAPSPATSGTSLAVTAGQGALFPTVPFYCTIWPAGVSPLSTNAEIIKVTGVSTDTFTIVRAQFSSSAVSAAIGYQIANTVIADSLAGRLIGKQVFTTTGAGTYTPTAGTNYIVMELVGGGGGSGGSASAGLNAVSLAGGGGGGAWLRKTLVTAFSGAAYVVGAKGTGGAAGANNGTDATDTTFTATGGGGTVYTAGGGKKGSTTGSFAPPLFAYGGINGVGGVATNGDENVSGEDPLPAISMNTGDAQCSRGGASKYSRFSTLAFVGGNTTSVAGVNATGKGGGGGGAAGIGTAIARAGGDGTDGMIIIWEYT